MIRRPPRSTLFPYTTPSDLSTPAAFSSRTWRRASSGVFGVRIICAFKASRAARSEEHTSELQSLTNLVCRLLLEKKKTNHDVIYHEPQDYRITGMSWTVYTC